MLFNISEENTQLSLGSHIPNLRATALVVELYRGRTLAHTHARKLTHDTCCCCSSHVVQLAVQRARRARAPVCHVRIAELRRTRWPVRCGRIGLKFLVACAICVRARPLGGIIKSTENHKKREKKKKQAHSPQCVYHCALRTILRTLACARAHAHMNDDKAFTPRACARSRIADSRSLRVRERAQTI